ncbi:NADH-quinone oxidoreductase subunit J [Buchnera aphidicola (Formosaphis micheliae)]|uniref:NADH-quinone oxidoreductase subunit J n=1 Tax=Buchnera aphidicola TaxID=9 RepID=UPI0031B8B2E6
MEFIFYALGTLVTFFTILSIFTCNPVYALIYLIVSLLFISGIFFLLGDIFPAVLEIIIYAGAIMVLFIFVIMLLNLGKYIEKTEMIFLNSNSWRKISVLFLFFLIALVYSISYVSNLNITETTIDIKEMGMNLFGSYIYIVELVSILLLNTLILVFHFGKNRYN